MTPKKLSNLQIAKTDTPRNQIRNHVRELILSGSMAPDDELPTTQKLAGAWKSHPSTVHRALTDLVHEGLLIRRRSHGTFVAKRMGKLRSVGIHCDADVLLAPWHAFGREVVNSVRELLKARGIETHIFVDSRNGQERRKIWEQLKSAAEDREIQGLISLIPHLESMSWLRRFPVPLAILGASRKFRQEAFGVESDLAQLASESVSTLAAQGCRSVGYIGGGSQGRGPALKFYEQFAKAAQHHGLKFKRAWFQEGGGKMQEAFGGLTFGHHAMTKLLSQKERPDGFLVYPDDFAQGALAALRVGRVRVPNDLRIVLHRNEKQPYPCPYPVTYAVISERAFAEALIQQLDTQVGGDRSHGIQVPFQFVSSTKLDRGPLSRS